MVKDYSVGESVNSNFFSLKLVVLKNARSFCLMGENVEKGMRLEKIFSTDIS